MPGDQSKKRVHGSYLGRKQYKKQLDEAGDISPKPQKPKEDKENAAFSTGYGRNKNRMVRG